MSISGSGEVLGRLDVREEVRSVSAAGRYLGVLYADRLVLYNEKLEVYSTLRGTDQIQRALVRRDGTALLLGANTARLFLP